MTKWKNKKQSSTPEWTNKEKSKNIEQESSQKSEKKEYKDKKCEVCNHLKGSHQFKKFEDGNGPSQNSSCEIDGCDCKEYKGD